MKTTEEWYETLNEKYREKALKNMTSPKAKHHSLLGAISNGFDWNKSLEGSEFWIQAFREIRTGNYAPVETKQEVVNEVNEVSSEKQKIKTEKQNSKNEVVVSESTDEPTSQIETEPIVKNKVSTSISNVYNSLEEMNFSTKK